MQAGTQQRSEDPPPRHTPAGMAGWVTLTLDALQILKGGHCSQMATYNSPLVKQLDRQFQLVMEERYNELPAVWPGLFYDEPQKPLRWWQNRRWGLTGFRWWLVEKLGQLSEWVEPS